MLVGNVKVIPMKAKGHAFSFSIYILMYQQVSSVGVTGARASVSVKVQNLLKDIKQVNTSH